MNRIKKYNKYFSLIKESIKESLESLDSLKFELGNNIQKYIYTIESTSDLDKMDKDIVFDKLESLRVDINSSLDELKANILMEKESNSNSNLDINYPIPGAYAILTKELSDRLNTPSISDGYLFYYDTKDRLEKLKGEYPIGSSYNGEEIISVDFLKLNNIL